MVRIRFRRVGARNQPSYRIVAADRESPRDGRFLEVLGFYNPRTEPATVRVDESRLFHWLKNGAQPSDSVRRTLGLIGTWDRWERYKQGEALDKLLAEAKEAMPQVDPRTRLEGLVGKRSKKRRVRKAAPEAEATPVAEAIAEPQPEPVAAEAPQSAEMIAEEPEAEEPPQAAEEPEAAPAPEEETPAEAEEA